MPPTAAATMVPKMPTICPDRPRFAVFATVTVLGKVIVSMLGAVVSSPPWVVSLPSDEVMSSTGGGGVVVSTI
jgi:hypothetical protein